MLGIAHTLVAEKLHDEKFLQTYTVGFDQFLPYLMGDTDKTPKTAEWASAICGVPADTIRDLARRFAKNRTMLASGWSMQRQHRGEQVHWMLVTLAAMLGQIGLPGGGFGLSYHYARAARRRPTPRCCRHHRRRQGQGRSSVDDRKRRGVDPGRTRCRHAAQPRQGLRLQRHQGQVPRRQDVVLGRRQPVRPPPGPQPHGRRRGRSWRPSSSRTSSGRRRRAWPTSSCRQRPPTSATTSRASATIRLGHHRHEEGDRSGVRERATTTTSSPTSRSGSDRGGVQRRARRMDWSQSSMTRRLTAARAKSVSVPDFDTFWKAGVGRIPASDAARIRALRHLPRRTRCSIRSARRRVRSRSISEEYRQDGLRRLSAAPDLDEPFERLSGPGRIQAARHRHHPTKRLHSQLCGT